MNTDLKELLYVYELDPENLTELGKAKLIKLLIEEVRRK